MRIALVLLLVMITTGCDPVTGSPALQSARFVAVTDITGVPAQIATGRAHPLYGLVMPENAANQLYGASKTPEPPEPSSPETY